jgi:hypothetical protein
MGDNFPHFLQITFPPSEGLSLKTIPRVLRKKPSFRSAIRLFPQFIQWNMILWGDILPPSFRNKNIAYGTIHTCFPKQTARKTFDTPNK